MACVSPRLIEIEIHMAAATPTTSAEMRTAANIVMPAWYWFSASVRARLHLLADEIEVLIDGAHDFVGRDEAGARGHLARLDVASLRGNRRPPCPGS